MNILEELSVGPDQNEINELIEGPAENIKPEGIAVGCYYLIIILSLLTGF